MSPDLRSRPYDFFVSYARADDKEGRVQNLVTQLAAHGLRRYLDLTEIRTGENVQRNIQDGLTNAVSFLAFVSPAYLKSHWCRVEWQAWTQQLGVYRLQSDTRRIVLVDEIPDFDLRAEPNGIARRFLNSQNLQIDPDEFETLVDILRETQKSLYVLPTDHLAIAKLAEDLGSDGENHRVMEATPDTIPPHNWNFVGRQVEMDQLRDLLGKGDRTGVIHGIHGLGGMGKTELAIAYAHRFAKDYPGGRFWIRCEERTSLRDALLSETSFTIQFWDQITDEQRKQPEIYYEALKLTIGNAIRESGPMLLVLDNVSHAEVVNHDQIDGLGAFNGKLHLIATTRNPPPAGSNWLRLDRLPEPDALALLARHRPYGSDEDRAAAEMLVRKLGGFTLAIELVGAWAAVHQTGYARLAERIDLSVLDNLGDDREVKLRRHNDAKRLSAILSPVLDQLDPLALRILQAAAFLPPDQAPLSWLRVLTSLRFPQLLSSEPLLDSWKEAVRTLQRWSLLTAPSADGRLVRVHRLIQELTLARMPEGEREAESTAIGGFATERANGICEDRSLLQEAWELDPLEALAWQREESGNPSAFILLGVVGRCLQEASQWARAEALYRRALGMTERALGPFHVNVAACLNNLATLLHETNRLAEAEPLIRRSLESYERNYGPDDPRVAPALSNLVSLLQDTDRISGAEPLMRRALKIVEQAYGPDHPDVAIALGNLAHLLQATNRLAEAEPLIRRAIAIDERCFGADHPGLAPLFNNLGNLLLESNRLGEAEPLLTRALEIDERSYGPDHPNAALRLGNLAQLLHDMNRLAEAEPLVRRALDIDERCFSPHHPRVATWLGNLASLLCKTERRAEAEPLMRRALDIDERSFGPDHPSVAVCLNNLALLLKDTGRAAEAEPLARRQLRILARFERIHGHRHARFMASCSNYAEILAEAGFDIPDVGVATALLVPQVFDSPLRQDRVAAIAHERIEQARRDGKTFVADTLQELLDGARLATC